MGGGWHCSALFLGVFAFLPGTPLGDPFGGVYSGQFWLPFCWKNRPDLMWPHARREANPGIEKPRRKGDFDGVSQGPRLASPGVDQTPSRFGRPHSGPDSPGAELPCSPRMGASSNASYAPYAASPACVQPQPVDDFAQAAAVAEVEYSAAVAEIACPGKRQVAVAAVHDANEAEPVSIHRHTRIASHHRPDPQHLDHGVLGCGGFIDDVRQVLVAGRGMLLPES